MSKFMQKSKGYVNHEANSNELYNWLKNFLLRYLQDKIGEKKINELTNFSEMGIDSKIINTFNKDMSKIIPKISKTVLFEISNIEELATYFIMHYENEVINLRSLDMDDSKEVDEILEENSNKQNKIITEKKEIQVKQNQELEMEEFQNKVEDSWDEEEAFNDIEDPWGDENIGEIGDTWGEEDTLIAETEEDGWGEALSDIDEDPWNEEKFDDLEDPWDSKEISLNEVDDDKVNKSDIGIIGVSGRYPLADSVEEFWQNIMNGIDCITEIPIERWDYRKEYDPDRTKENKVFSKWGGFINDVDKFDPMFFNMTPMDAEGTDPQERLFLQVAYEAIQDAGYTKKSLEGKKVGVFVGVMYSHYNSIGIEESVKRDNVSLNALHASVANRVSYFFNLSGPSIAIDTMCSSSITALYLAYQSMKNGDCDMAIVGGVNLTLHPDKYRFLCGGKLASSEGKCRAFGDGGDGYVPGEGVGAIVLKKVKDAINDRDQIYAKIKGIAINHGGRTSGYTVPNPNAQANVIRDALKKSKVNPRTISYVEAHGTGTPLGDPIEITGITKAYRDYTQDNQYCAIGSVKANIGHLESAAGIAAITKVILQMKKKKLVPTILSEIVNPNLNFTETPFYLQHDVKEWKRPIIKENGKKKECLRRAAISAFGAGGSNAHVIFEEANDSNETYDNEVEEKQVIVLSAKNNKQLKIYVKKFIDYLEKMIFNDEKVSLADVAYTLQVGREAMGERISMVVSSLEELKSKLEMYYEGENKIRNFYIGDKDKYLNDLILTDEEGDLYIERIIKHGKINKIAQLWALGVDFDWEMINLNKKVRKVSLPTYPFEKRRCWPLEVKESLIDVHEKIKIDKSHPLIDENRSTFEEQCFYKHIDKNTVYVNESKEVLPSVLIEMILYSANSSTKNNYVSKISNIEFIKPCLADKLDMDINVGLSSTEEGVEFEVYSSVDDEKNESFCIGECEFSEVEYSSNNEESIDIEGISEACLMKKVQRDFYTVLSKNNITYGNSMKNVKEFGMSEDEVISYIEIDDAISYKFLINPEVLEGAFQSILYMLLKENEQQYRISYIEELFVYKKIEKKAYSYAKYKYEDKNLSADILIVDESGNIAAEINNVIFSINDIENS